MMNWLSREISPDPADMLWHYACGETPCYLQPGSDAVGWMKYSHRGVQFMDQVVFPRKQKRYIFSPEFEIRYDQAFEEVVRGCADLEREGRTWITSELIDAYARLHRLGYAHSYEAWQDGQLVGGAFGIHIGGFITCESMFHRVSNASKAAWGQTLLHLRDRGFRWIDTNCVASHHVNFGEQWLPHWKFEAMIREALTQPVSFMEGRPCPPVPWQLRLGLPLRRVTRGAVRRLRTLRGRMSFRSNMEAIQ